jgi:hypothetical protein
MLASQFKTWTVFSSTLDLKSLGQNYYTYTTMIDYAQSVTFEQQSPELESYWSETLADLSD